MVFKKGNVLKRSDLKNGILNGLSSKRKTKRNSFHASSGFHCPRRNFAHLFLSNKYSWQAKNELYTKIGISVHTAIQNALFLQNKVLFSEYRLPPLKNLNIGGYVDLIGLVDGKISVIEIKTCGKLPTKPNKDHRKQAIVYSIITGFDAYLVYQSRNVADFKGVKIETFKIDTNYQEMLDIMKVYYISELCVQKEKLPPIPAHFKSASSCGYCPFKEKCWGDEKFPFIDISLNEYSDILEEAEELAAKFIDDVNERRNGILAFLSKNGTTTAKKLLKGRLWDGLY